MAAISLPESTPPRITLVESTSADLAAFITSGDAFSKNKSDGESWLPSERKLAVRFGVSRPVIREATKRLELQGLVEIHHGRGTKIARQLQRPLSRSLVLQIPNDFDRLRQLNETRRILEPETARLAASRAGKSDLAALDVCHRQLINSTNNLAEAAKIDAHFHELIARAAKNDAIALILSSFSDLGEASRRRTLNTSGIDKAIRHHAGILEAIRKQNPDKAARLMTEHIGEASADLEASSK